MQFEELANNISRLWRKRASSSTMATRMVRSDVGVAGDGIMANGEKEKFGAISDCPRMVVREAAE
jgi:hypothetical protein